MALIREIQEDRDPQSDSRVETPNIRVAQEPRGRVTELPPPLPSPDQPQGPGSEGLIDEEQPLNAADQIRQDATQAAFRGELADTAGEAASVILPDTMSSADRIRAIGQEGLAGVGVDANFGNYAERVVQQRRWENQRLMQQFEPELYQSNIHGRNPLPTFRQGVEKFTEGILSDNQFYQMQEMIANSPNRPEFAPSDFNLFSGPQHTTPLTGLDPLANVVSGEGGLPELQNRQLNQPIDFENQERTWAQRLFGIIPRTVDAVAQFGEERLGMPALTEDQLAFERQIGQTLAFPSVFAGGIARGAAHILVNTPLGDAAGLSDEADKEEFINNFYYSTSRNLAAITTLGFATEQLRGQERSPIDQLERNMAVDPANAPFNPMRGQFGEAGQGVGGGIIYGLQTYDDGIRAFFQDRADATGAYAANVTARLNGEDVPDDIAIPWYDPFGLREIWAPGNHLQQALTGTEHSFMSPTRDDGRGMAWTPIEEGEIGIQLPNGARIARWLPSAGTAMGFFLDAVSELGTGLILDPVEASLKRTAGNIRQRAARANLPNLTGGTEAGSRATLRQAEPQTQSLEFESPTTQAPEVTTQLQPEQVTGLQEPITDFQLDDPFNQPTQFQANAPTLFQPDEFTRGGNPITRPPTYIDLLGGLGARDGESALVYRGPDGNIVTPQQLQTPIIRIDDVIDAEILDEIPIPEVRRMLPESLEPPNGRLANDVLNIERMTADLELIGHQRRQLLQQSQQLQAIDQAIQETVVDTYQAQRTPLNVGTHSNNTVARRVSQALDDSPIAQQVDRTLRPIEQPTVRRPVASTSLNEARQLNAAGNLSDDSLDIFNLLTPENERLIQRADQLFTDSTSIAPSLGLTDDVVAESLDELELNGLIETNNEGLVRATLSDEGNIAIPVQPERAPVVQGTEHIARAREIVDRKANRLHTTWDLDSLPNPDNATRGVDDVVQAIRRSVANVRNDEFARRFIALIEQGDDINRTVDSALAVLNHPQTRIAKKKDLIRRVERLRPTQTLSDTPLYLGTKETEPRSIPTVQSATNPMGNGYNLTPDRDLARSLAEAEIPRDSVKRGPINQSGQIHAVDYTPSNSFDVDGAAPINLINDAKQYIEDVLGIESNDVLGEATSYRELLDNFDQYVKETMPGDASVESVMFRNALDDSLLTSGFDSKVTGDGRIVTPLVPIEIREGIEVGGGSRFEQVAATQELIDVLRDTATLADAAKARLEANRITNDVLSGQLRDAETQLIDVVDQKLVDEVNYEQRLREIQEQRKIADIEELTDEDFLSTMEYDELASEFVDDSIWRCI